jgi:hypothetical protein
LDAADEIERRVQRFVILWIRRDVGLRRSARRLRISFDLGQFVVTGEPVAVMGGGAQSAVAKAGGANQFALP